ncbi:MAG: restriction endonuclease subunit S [Armatimonadota bacterium]
MSFPRYPKYKYSGVEWLGDVPEGWSIVPLKIAAAVAVSGIDKKLKDDEKRIRFLGTDTVYSSERITPEIELEECSASDEQIRSFTLLAEDVVVTKDSVVPTKIAVVSYVDQPPEQAVCGYHLALVRSHPQRAVGLFLFYSLKSTALASYFLSEARGTTIIGIGGGIIGKAAVPLPAFPEQTAIADFLDRETGKIHELVAEQRRLMELLKEKRQAVISHAVTKGLNPHAPMKPSGIEWLGDVPKHWKVMKLKRVTLSRCDGPFGSGLKSEHYCDEGIRVIRLQNIRSGQFYGRDSAFISPQYYKELGDHSVVPGDLLIAGLGDENHSVGRACVAPSNIGPAMVKADCFRFRLNSKLASASYLALQLSTTANALAGALSTGTTRGRMNLSASETREIVLPPLAEQLDIIEFLETELAKFDTLTDEAQRAIDLLQERRTALISAAVTGQIDVRTAHTENLTS